MKRPMCVIGFPFGAAMCAAFLFEGGAALLISLALALTGALVFLAGGKKGLLWLSAALLSAGAAFGVYAVFYEREIAPFERAGGHIVTVEGLVTDIKISSGAIDYTVSASFPKVRLPDTALSLRDYGEPKANIGDVIRFRAEILPGGATGYGGAVKARLKSEPSYPDSDGYAFERWRLSLRKSFSQNLFSKMRGESASVVGTMVLNTGGDIAPEIYTHMNRSGISHILSISGMHFSLISAFVLMVFRGLKLPRRMPELLTIAFGLVFAFLAGFSPAIMRAYIMFSAVMAGDLFRRRADGVNSLGFAVLFISVVWPRWTQSIGMWLSALSTLGILLVGRSMSHFLYIRLKGQRSGELKLVKTVTDSAGISIGAYMFTLPLLMIKNGWVSLIAPLTNILVAPLAAPLLMGGLLCSLVPANPMPVRVAGAVTEFCAEAMIKISGILSSVPFAVIPIDEFYMLIWIFGAAAMAAVLLVTQPGKRTAAYAAMLCVISLFAGNMSAVAAGRDVTELVTIERCSPAMIIRGNAAVLLGAPDKYEINTLLKYLDYRGIRRIDCVFAGNLGDNIDSGLTRLAESKDIGVIVGPNDAYTADLIAHAVKGVPVYMGGYSTTRVLESADVRMDIRGELEIVIGDTGIGMHYREYAPVLEDDGRIHLYNGGELLLPEGINPVLEPVGAGIYGETRILLKGLG